MTRQLWSCVPVTPGAGSHAEAHGAVIYIEISEREVNSSLIVNPMNAWSTLALSPIESLNIARDRVREGPSVMSREIAKACANMSRARRRYFPSTVRLRNSRSTTKAEKTGPYMAMIHDHVLCAARKKKPGPAPRGRLVGTTDEAQS